MVLGRDVDMVRGETLHQGRAGAGSHQPGHVGGALLSLRSEGIPPVWRHCDWD